MWCAYQLLITLLLCNSYFNLVTAKDDFLDENGHLKPESAYIDERELLRLFKKLEISKLVKVASTNAKTAAIAQNAYRSQYHNFEVKIWNGSPYGISVVDFAGLKRIEMTDFDSALSALQYFGGEMKELRIVEEFKKTILEHIKEPLKQVEILQIEIKQSGNEISPLNQLFPKVIKLAVHLKAATDFEFIDCALPHLEHLAIHLSNGAWKQKSQIEGLIRNNPQVKSIEINGFPSNYIKDINKLLPNIERLILNDQQIDTGDETVRFENLKHLEFIGQGKMSTSSGSIENVSCPKLESVRLSYLPKFAKKWAIFFNNHQQLRNLHMDYCPFGQLAEVTAELKNLVTMEMQFDELGTVEEFRSFFDGHPNLKEAYFSTFTKLKPEEERNIHDSLRDDWSKMYIRARYGVNDKETTFVFLK